MDAILNYLLGLVHGAATVIIIGGFLYLRRAGGKKE